MLFIVRTDDFDFQLPDELIAQAPAVRRDGSRLLVLDRHGPGLDDSSFARLPALLRAGDLLVLNDTRVMAARLRGVWDDTGGDIEILLTARVSGNTWNVLMQPAQRARPGRRLTLSATDGDLTASVEGRDGEAVTVRFDRSFDPLNVGEVPLPPYIRGFSGEAERYQTVYARSAGSAAAPTAGLHFTPEILDEIGRRNVEIADLTLDVGPGTFLPVRTDDPACHAMHSERFFLPAETVRAVRRAKEAGGRVVAVGTTVVRSLEAAWTDAGLSAGEQRTNLLILPGHEFRVVDAMLTNFHLPRSTLLMLVSAFAGRRRMLDAYAHAVASRYRFYSLGDAMFIG